MVQVFNGLIYLPIFPNQPTTFDNFNSQSSYNLMIKVHPSDQNTIYIGGTNLWRSTDGFTTPNNTIICGGYLIGSYEEMEIGGFIQITIQINDVLFLPSNSDVMFSATDGGIYRTDDCFKDTVEWTSLNNGYLTSQLYTATTSKNNANSEVLHGGFQDNGNFVTFSGNPTDHWSMPFNGDGAYSGIADNEEDFYLTIQRGVAIK